MEDEDELSLVASFGLRSQPEQRDGQRKLQVRPPKIPNPEEFVDIDSEDESDDNTIDAVLAEIPGEDLLYRVRFKNGSKSILPFEDVIEAEGGQEALSAFEQAPVDHGSDEEMPSASSEEESRRGARKTRRRGPADAIEISDSSDADSDAPRAKRARPSRGRKNQDSSEEEAPPRRRGLARRGGPRKAENVRRSSRQANEEVRYQEVIESSSEDDRYDLLDSDIRPRKKMRQEEPGRSGLRTSGRTTKNSKSMVEASLGDVFRSDSDTPRVPKVTATKEIFENIPRSDPFAQRHLQACDACGRPAGPVGQLVYCQGCSLAYHKQCLGARNSRDHLVTKIDEEEFVLQCRRCINLHRRKDNLAPDHAICQTCREVGPACAPFRARKTTAQEQKEREDNDGIDPVTDVSRALINNADNVLFRCRTCARGFHYHHLPSKEDMMDIVGDDDDVVADQRLREYGNGWECKECSEKPDKIGSLIAWRPTDPEDYNPTIDNTEAAEDEKEYLIKWDKRSYFQSQWMPGAWTWGVTAFAMRKAFAKRNNERNPAIMTMEEAIPEDYLRIDIVLDVKFTSFVETRAEEIDKARIREVDTALMKYKGLGYEDAVWEKVPTPEDGDRWVDFVKAYDDWVIGRYVKIPKSGPLKARVDKARSQNFSELEKKEQPKSLSGGKLMNYQLDGLNWLYFRWQQAQNGILADEMGLGKTIQIIGMLAALVEDHNCFPFLLVVPNSTCPNWRREIKQWAPSLRVVTYYGAAQARRLAYEHELFPEGSKTLRCHIVVTSYETACDEGAKKLFKSTPWQGLIVDEGQRLKSDKTNLYGVLKDMKIPFSILLTGTPLQNNARELFNLLQFLDPAFNAEALELEYSELTKENIPQLHEMIRPFFLRRTKAQVLKFLPPLAQVILPVSMSVVQRKLYKSILSKNPDLLKAIFNTDRPVGKGDKSSLNNILMQLRKCLAHPFVYSTEIEERDVSHQVQHRNLIDASAKFKLLELLLPALKEKGHRVLIFSQFLDMLMMIEDFLDGLEYKYQRLDGTVSSLQKQSRIDKFNEPGSEDFAFLLSTRAGGVGINLATADTVIIMDPDFNPHQDIQALSRAHRIGQTKKVLCFQLMTHASVEEKIMQIGRKKMALDHVLIERMDDSEESVVDVESILKHGAAAILEGVEESDIRYDQASIEKLLDRSGIENTNAGEDMTAESQFSFARVWANDSGSLKAGLEENAREERAPDVGVWDQILQERERLAAEEAAARQQAFGRGRRTKQNVDYDIDRIPADESPIRHPQNGSGSDTDFREGKSSDDDDDEPDAPMDIDDDVGGIYTTMDGTADGKGKSRVSLSRPGQGSSVPAGRGSQANMHNASGVTESMRIREGLLRQSANAPPGANSPALGPGRPAPGPPGPPGHARPVGAPSASVAPPSQPKATVMGAPHVERVRKQWRRSNVMWPNNPQELPLHATDAAKANPPPMTESCLACASPHRIGYCPLKLADVEYCNLCGLAHYGKARTCPHIRSETQVRAMLHALKHSNEPPELVHEATKYLNGVKGNLAQHKRKMAAQAQGIPYDQYQAAQHGVMPQSGGSGAGAGAGGIVHAGTSSSPSAAYPAPHHPLAIHGPSPHAVPQGQGQYPGHGPGPGMRHQHQQGRQGVFSPGLQTPHGFPPVPSPSPQAQHQQRFVPGADARAGQASLGNANGHAPAPAAR